MSLDSDEIKSRFSGFIRDFQAKEKKDDKEVRIYDKKLNTMVLEVKNALVIDYDDLVTFVPEVSSTLLEFPEDTLNTLNDCFDEIMLERDTEFYEAVKKTKSFYVRFINLPNEVEIRQIRARDLDFLWSINGIIIKATEVKPLLINATFRCEECKQFINLQQFDGYRTPTTCENVMCRNTKKGSFQLITNASELIDWQVITIQEKPEDLPPAMAPRSVSCRLLSDLVDVVRPGDRVEVFGVLKAAANFKQGKKPIFEVWMDVNNVIKDDEDYEETLITPEEEKKIIEYAKLPNIHELVSQSIAPALYGLETIKTAIMLMLVGGNNKQIQDLKLRGISHLLLVGDPGLGKSQLLKAAQSISPRAVYTSGKGSTAAGLSAAIVKDPDTGEFTLEAGAVVLADRGVACIDEFDKMRKDDRSAIHEMMEQGTVSIAKAGIIATLNAQTSILAAANPKFGRYAENKTASENIDLPPPILSRFDLIFVLQDIPNDATDDLLATHILNLHQDNGKQQIEPFFETAFLRKYIAYVKRNCYPLLSDDAVETIREFYKSMRSISTDVPGAAIAITARQLEALVRLTEARARVALRTKATKTDALAAIDLFTESLRQVGIDPETGQIDINILTSGTSKSQRSKLEHIFDIIYEQSGTDKSDVSINTIVLQASKLEITETYVTDLVDRMIREGRLYQPSQGYVRVIN